MASEHSVCVRITAIEVSSPSKALSSLSRAVIAAKTQFKEAICLYRCAFSPLCPSGRYTHLWPLHISVGIMSGSVFGSYSIADRLKAAVNTLEQTGSSLQAQARAMGQQGQNQGQGSSSRPQSPSTTKSSTGATGSGPNATTTAANGSSSSSPPGPGTATSPTKAAGHYISQAGDAFTGLRKSLHLCTDVLRWRVWSEFTTGIIEWAVAAPDSRVEGYPTPGGTSTRHAFSTHCDSIRYRI